MKSGARTGGGAVSRLAQIIARPGTGVYPFKATGVDAAVVNFEITAGPRSPADASPCRNDRTQKCDGRLNMVTLRLAEKSFGTSPASSSKFLEQIHAKGYFGFFPNENWIPNVNLYETEMGYVVCVDLAGVDKEKIEIEVHDGRLRLRGHRQVPQCDETPGARVRVHLMEIDHGAFARDVELPQDVRHDNINATVHQWHALD